MAALSARRCLHQARHDVAAYAGLDYFVTARGPYSFSSPSLSLRERRRTAALQGGPSHRAAIQRLPAEERATLKLARNDGSACPPLPCRQASSQSPSLFLFFSFKASAAGSSRSAPPCCAPPARFREKQQAENQINALECQQRRRRQGSTKGGTRRSLFREGSREKRGPGFFNGTCCCCPRRRRKKGGGGKPHLKARSCRQTERAALRLFFHQRRGRVTEQSLFHRHTQNPAIV